MSKYPTGSMSGGAAAALLVLACGADVVVGERGGTGGAGGEPIVTECQDIAWAQVVERADSVWDIDVARDGSTVAAIGGGLLESVGAFELGDASGVAIVRFDPCGTPEWVHVVEREHFLNLPVAVAATEEGAVVALTSDESLDDLGLPVAAGSDVAVFALDGAGQIAWAWGSGDVAATPLANFPPLALDEDGNIYLAGVLEQPADLGTGTLSPEGRFLLSLSSDGSPRWARSLTGGAGSEGGQLAVFDEGVAFIAFSGAVVDWGGGPLVPEGDESNMVIGAFDRDGEHLWSRIYACEGTSCAAGRQIVAGHDGMLTLLHFSQLELGIAGAPAPLAETSHSVFRFSSSGPEWASVPVGSLADDIAVLTDGSVVGVGVTTEAATVGDVTLTPTADHEGTLFRIDTSGDLLGAELLGGGERLWAQAVASRPGGGVTVGGRFYSSAVVGSLALEGTSSTVFIAYLPTGQLP